MGIDWGYSGTVWDSMGEYIDHVALSEKLTYIIVLWRFNAI